MKPPIAKRCWPPLAPAPERPELASASELALASELESASELALASELESASELALELELDWAKGYR